MKATNSGKLNLLGKCQIVIPTQNMPNSPVGKDSYEIGRFINGEYILTMNNLPEISDTKSAVYNNEPIIGRSAPLYTYSHSADRTISFQIHFFNLRQGDAENNLEALRIIQSALYPRESSNYPYLPPPICRIKCGSLLASSSNHLCVVLQSYSVKFPTDVAWESNTEPKEIRPGLWSLDPTYCPYRFDVDTSWLVVYSSDELPFQSRIITSGR